MSSEQWSDSWEVPGEWTEDREPMAEDGQLLEGPNGEPMLYASLLLTGGRAVFALIWPEGRRAYAVDFGVGVAGEDHEGEIDPGSAIEDALRALDKAIEVCARDDGDPMFGRVPVPHHKPRYL